MWDAAQYLKFSNERGRPFADLLAQVSCTSPRLIVDLGCGAGNLTRTLADRWPEARVLGVDSSAEMLAKAAMHAIPGRLSFEQADVAGWSYPEPVDLIVSNAALHWVGDHHGLLARLVAQLGPSGTLAVQMPNRFQTPAQKAIEETTADPRWAATLTGVGLHRESVRPLNEYVNRLIELGCLVNAWETTYFHVLRGENPVLEWLKGTGLRPLMQKLPERQLESFLDALARRLKAAYPEQQGATIFPFPRLFFVAVRTGAENPA